MLSSTQTWSIVPQSLCPSHSQLVSSSFTDDSEYQKVNIILFTTHSQVIHISFRIFTPLATQQFKGALTPNLPPYPLHLFDHFLSPQDFCLDLLPHCLILRTLGLFNQASAFSPPDFCLDLLPQFLILRTLGLFNQASAWLNLIFIKPNLTTLLHS